MSDKCEWKDGKLNPCGWYLSALEAGCHILLSNSGIKIEIHNGSTIMLHHCPGCGESVIKPEPEVIIIKSGGTWVFLYENKDYLVIEPKDFMPKNANLYEWVDSGLAKPISEIEITDEIAKLRPMVVIDDKANNVRELVGVKNNISIHWHEFIMSDSSFTKDISLATVSDLEATE